MNKSLQLLACAGMACVAAAASGSFEQPKNNGNRHRIGSNASKATSPRFRKTRHGYLRRK